MHIVFQTKLKQKGQAESFSHNSSIVTTNLKKYGKFGLCFKSREK